ncbi:MAG: pantoate--beta-alanine ligase [Chitinophagaceae bacterium]|nr:pantoate--beta-alanine ligase [Chitinophagaceae bacterium]
MYIIKTQNELRAYLTGKSSIGFVPTMGALHQGHIGLIEKSMQENEVTGCSIFVNPAQFNHQSDFDKYPVNIENDLELLLTAGCDFLFLPTVNEMYPHGFQSLQHYDLGYLDSVLEGEFRPGHFNGVCAIVHKLLQAVMPQNLYMGAKDFQQCMVIKRLLEITALPVQLIICPTEREADGLAMSSRNLRLSAEGRSRAATIYKGLTHIRQHQYSGSFAALQNACIMSLATQNIETEYLALADTDTLQLLPDFNAGSNMVVLFAGRLEGVRLIDNLTL